MDNTQAANIEIRDIQLANLVANVATGKYRVPQFQREFVWKKAKVIELFDSIYREFPIGSFFMWDAETDSNFLFRELVGLDLPPVGEHDDITFILDGQQRVTSIYVVLNGLTLDDEDYSTICFDLDTEKFVEEQADDLRYIRVCDIWAPTWVNLIPQVTEERQTSLAACWQRLQTYPISIVEVRNKPLADVCDIFQRINQSGKRLGRFDLVCAMTFSPNFNLRDHFAALTQHLETTQFGEIKPGCVTQLLALHKFDDCGEAAQFELTGNDVQNAWPAASNAVKLACDAMRATMGVMNNDFLPYDAQLTLMSYYFLQGGLNAVQPQHVDWLQQWFWRTSFSQHYGAQTSSRINSDKQLFDDLLSGESPDQPCGLSLEITDLITVKMNQTTAARRNAFLCLLAVQHPVHLLNNQAYDLVYGEVSDFNKKEKHHIFPRGYLDEQGIEDIHALPNFCFLTAELNKIVSDSAPATYIPEMQSQNPDFATAAEKSLLPPVDISGLLDNDYATFLPGYSHWTGTLLGQVLGLPADQVRRILRRLKIKLHQVKSWCLSDDPDFAAKASDIVGLYLSPPEGAVVLCMDEKPSIQALQRAQGWLRLPDGKALTGAAHEYKRNGTTTLFAALQLDTGQVLAGHYQRRRRREFLDFMNTVVAQYGPDTELHVILDNLSTHKPRRERWLKRHPKVHFHYTPTHASWLNQIETWFSKLSRAALRRASFKSVKQLREAISACIAAHNEHAEPCEWTKADVRPKPLKQKYAELCT